MSREERGTGRDGGQRLLNTLGCTAEGKRGRQGGPGVGAAWRAGTGNKEGACARRGTAQADGIGPQLVGVSGGVAARQ
jgi:hypothetical protein